MLEDEAKSKAKLKAAKKQMKEVLMAPPTTKVGIKKMLERYAFPMINYILKRISQPPPENERNGKSYYGDRFEAVEFFRGAGLLNPRTLKNDTAASRHERIEKLCRHPALDVDEVREGLHHELPSLLMSCNATALPAKLNDYDFLHFHWKHKKERPYCYRAVKIVAVTQPSSATVERVFSMLRAMFGDQQVQMKGDKKKLGLQYRYNIIFEIEADGARTEVEDEDGDKGDDDMDDE